MPDEPINAGHPTEGDPVMEEHYEAVAEQIASDVAARREEVDAMDDEEFDADFLDDGTLEIEDENALADIDVLRARVRTMVELRGVRDQKKQEFDEAKAAFEKFQRDLYEDYQKSPLKGSIKVDIGDSTVQLVPRATKYARVLDRDKAEQYLKERGLTKQFIKDDFRMGRLHEMIREHIEQGKPLPDGIDYYTKEFFTITVKD